MVRSIFPVSLKILPTLHLWYLQVTSPEILFGILGILKPGFHQ